MTVSPDGTKIASTSKAGVLFVHDSSTGQLLGGFKVGSSPALLLWLLLSVHRISDTVGFRV